MIEIHLCKDSEKENICRNEWIWIKHQASKLVKYGGYDSEIKNDFIRLKLRTHNEPNNQETSP